MRILVTGAAGFIGWNLVRELRRRHRNAEIVGVDDLSTGRRRSGENVDRMFEADICSHSALGDIGKFDVVYHLASPASPIKYQRFPLRTIHANVVGLMKCLGFHQADSGTIFFASSSEVYGDPLISPQPETYKGCVSCTGPRACYDESKRMCETIMLEWGRAHPEQHVKIARLFNVYGPGTLPDDGRCMSNFIWDAMNGRPCTIYGDGLQTRCFTYVDNVVRAIVDLVENTGDFVGPVNIGTNVESTVRDIAVAVMAEAAVWRQRKGLSVRIPPPEWLPAPADDPRQRLPDLTLAQQMLGWDVRRLVQHSGPSGGIMRTIKHFEVEYWRDDETDSDQPPEAVAAGDTPESAGVPVGPGGVVGAVEPG